MPRINPSFMVHILNVSSSFPSVRLKKRCCLRKRQSYSGRNSQATRSKFQQTSILFRLVGQRSDREKGKRQVEDVSGLH